MMASKSTFDRTSLEETAYKRAMRYGRRLFEQTPSGVTVVNALGVQAVAVGAYSEEGRGRVQRSYSIARHDYGIRVVTHRLYAGPDCRRSSCFSVDLMEGVTELDQLNGKDVSIISRLAAQNAAFDAIELAAGSGRDVQHNPFIGKTALHDLRLIAEHHEDDLFAEIVEAAEAA